jgi:hypothetical protein
VLRIASPRQVRSELESVSRPVQISQITTSANVVGLMIVF